MIWLFLLALSLIGIGFFSLRRSRQLYQESGLPFGRLRYMDSPDESWQAPPRPFYSARYGLSGKPDYLVETEAGLIPIEVKSGPAPPVPYVGHLLQVAAYCLLVEEQSGQTPAHGWLKYADALYEIDFGPELRRELLETMAEMRQDYGRPTVSRSHDQPAKCRACGFFEICSERLGE
jgi:CRISPR-associated exonuclease Cas4